MENIGSLPNPDTRGVKEFERETIFSLGGGKVGSCLGGKIRRYLKLDGVLVVLITLCGKESMRSRRGEL
jgi:hypothetical protein